jgi:hypothetical protein
MSCTVVSRTRADATRKRKPGSPRTGRALGQPWGCAERGDGAIERIAAPTPDCNDGSTPKFCNAHHDAHKVSKFLTK